jgi:hypothetical protein
MNNIQLCEETISAGNWGEPVGRFRVYCLTKDPEILARGADWTMSAGFNDRDDADAYVDHGDEGFFWAVVDGREYGLAR